MTAIFSGAFWTLDFVGLAMMVREVYVARQLPPFDVALAQIIMLSVFFFFGTGLYVWLNNDNEPLTRLVLVFSWAYLILSSLILIGMSYHFMTRGIYSVSDRLGHISLIMIMALLAYVMADITDQHSPYFACPFMLVALVQAIIWTYVAFYRDSQRPSHELAGDLLVIGVVGLMVVFFYDPDLVISRVSAWKKRLPNWARLPSGSRG